MKILMVAACAALMACSGATGAEVEDSVDRDYSEELPRIPAVEPGAALETFEVLPGYRLDLVAAEPLVHDPIAMAWDEFGRAFVVEMRGYSEAREENIGAVRLLEDTDGDGKFDASHEYVGGLAWPTAVACYDGGIYVAVPPDIWYCKDTDGDHKADIKEKVFTGFHLTNVQGLLNTFKWGLDNRLHGATSSSGADVVRVGSEDDALSLKGRDFSIDPKTNTLRPESGGAQHGLSFNQWGDKFVCSNSDHIQQVLYEDHYIGRNPNLAAPGPRVSIAADGAAADVFRISPVEPWRIVRTRLRVKGLVGGPVEGGGKPAGYFTGATGVTLYRGDAMPELVGNAFVGDVGGNLVHRKTVEGDGLVYVADRADPGTEFVRSNDIWFRPAQFCNAPDGGLYILDMYREVIEHPLSLPPMIKKHLDLNSGNDRGRLYRVVPEDYAQARRALPGDATDEELVAMLAHENGWHRQTAARLIYERQPDGIAPVLETMAKEGANAEGRIRAFYALDTLGALSPEVLIAGTDDTHARVRQHAVRLAGMHVQPGDGLSEKIRTLAGDEDLGVRYQTAFALGALPQDERVPALAAVGRMNPDDKWMRLAVLSSVPDGAGSVAGALLQDATFAETAGADTLLKELAEMAGSADDQADVAALLKGVRESADAKLSGVVVQALAKGMGEGGLEDASAAQELLAGMVADARAVVMDGDAETAARVEALSVLRYGTYEAAAETIQGLLIKDTAATIQAEAVRTLCAFDDPKVAEIVLGAWGTLGGAAKGVAVQRLATRTPWAVALLEAVQAGTVPVSFFDTTQQAVFARSGDELVKTLASKVFASSDTPRNVEAITKAVLATEGDTQRGMMLFNMNCAVCHTIGGAGKNVGPDLSTVGNGGKEKILLNIINPNAEVNPQYFNYVVETVDFETLSGILVAETATSVTLRRSGGVEDTILKKDIESMESTSRSIMPEDWENVLGVQGLADVTAFLSQYSG
jgi:putative membrane-bound dehydrogenase-like protein